MVSFGKCTTAILSIGIFCLSVPVTAGTGPADLQLAQLTGANGTGNGNGNGNVGNGNGNGNGNLGNNNGNNHVGNFAGNGVGATPNPISRRSVTPDTLGTGTARTGNVGTGNVASGNVGTGNLGPIRTETPGRRDHSDQREGAKPDSSVGAKTPGLELD